MKHGPSRHYRICTEHELLTTQDMGDDGTVHYTLVVTHVCASRIIMHLIVASFIFVIKSQITQENLESDSLREECSPHSPCFRMGGEGNSTAETGAKKNKVAETPTPGPTRDNRGGGAIFGGGVSHRHLRAVFELVLGFYCSCFEEMLSNVLSGGLRSSRSFAILVACWPPDHHDGRLLISCWWLPTDAILVPYS